MPRLFKRLHNSLNKANKVCAHRWQVLQANICPQEVDEQMLMVGSFKTAPDKIWNVQAASFLKRYFN